MSKSKLVEDARKYAIYHHGSQMFGEQPYYFHLDMVYDIVMKYGLGEEYQVGAYLHDLLEDTELKKNDLVVNFGEEVAEMVFCVSGFGETRKEKQENIQSKIKNNTKSVNLKMCDRLANLKTSKINKPKLYERYCKEHEQFDLDSIFSLGDSLLFNEIQQVLGKSKKNKNNIR